jgi:hypothetical protein
MEGIEPKLPGVRSIAWLDEFIELLSISLLER